MTRPRNKRKSRDKKDSTTPTAPPSTAADEFPASDDLEIEESLPSNPPPPSVADTSDKTKQLKFSCSTSSELYEEEEEDLQVEEGKPCIPQICTSDEFDDRTGRFGTRLSSDASLEFDLFQSPNRSGPKSGRGHVIRTETEAFVPVGGLVAPDKKRQEFRNYLQKRGFITALSKTLISLYDEPELPSKDEAIEFIAKGMGFQLAVKTELVESKAYCNILKARIQRLQAESNWLRGQLDNYEPSENPLEIVDPDNLPPIEYMKIRSPHRHHRKSKDEIIKISLEPEIQGEATSFGQMGSVILDQPQEQVKPKCKITLKVLNCSEPAVLVN